LCRRLAILKGITTHKEQRRVSRVTAANIYCSLLHAYDLSDMSVYMKAPFFRILHVSCCCFRLARSDYLTAKLQSRSSLARG
jgi:hypothetical protein